MLENDVSRVVVNCCYEIHTSLGPGLLESAYSRILHHELRKAGLHVESEVPIPLQWKGMDVGLGFRADLIVERCVIVELKSVQMLAAVHTKQLLTYLKITDLRLGLLVNFGEALIKNGLRRIVNNL